MYLYILNSTRSNEQLISARILYRSLDKCKITLLSAAMRHTVDLSLEEEEYRLKIIATNKFVRSRQYVSKLVVNLI